MGKILKKMVLGSLSVFVFSILCWILTFLNPQMLYAHETKIAQIHVYHNEPLAPEAADIILNALEIIKTSDLYAADIEIDFCLREGSFYPELHPFKGGMAYAFWNKAIIFDSSPNFKENTADYQWEVNQHELRKADLTWLLAHEFTHNLQYNHHQLLLFSYEFWQREGYAEYISRQWKGDGKLKEKIQFLLEEEKKEHKGLPVIKRADGTIQIFSYFKYGLMTQYLIEEEHLSFEKIGNDPRSFEEIYADMMRWQKRK